MNTSWKFLSYSQTSEFSSCLAHLKMATSRSTLIAVILVQFCSKIQQFCWCFQFFIFLQWVQMLKWNICFLSTSGQKNSTGRHLPEAETLSNLTTVIYTGTLVVWLMQMIQYSFGLCSKWVSKYVHFLGAPSDWTVSQTRLLPYAHSNSARS